MRNSTALRGKTVYPRPYALSKRAGFGSSYRPLEELDRDYDDILGKTIGEIKDLTGMPLRHDIGLSGITVFVASPNMVTSYHFDNETNFLFQIRGEKDVRLFDPQNRFVLTENEIEQFYSGSHMAGIYREEVLESGTLSHLTPGTAVHHRPWRLTW
jgi:hypothetical protein